MHTSSIFPRALAVCGSVLGLVAGSCSAPAPAPQPEPFLLPDLELSTRLVPGSNLSGPGAEPGPALAQHVLKLELRLLYLENAPESPLTPIESVSSLVVDLMGARPLLDRATLTAGASYALGQPALDWIAALEAQSDGRFEQLFGDKIVLPEGATLTLAATDLETVEDPLDWLDEYPDRGPIQKRVAVSLEDAKDGLSVALSVDDLDPVREAQRLEVARQAPIIRAEPPGPADEEHMRREMVLMDVAPRVGHPLLLVWPSPFETGSGRLFAALLTLRSDGLEQGVPTADEQRAQQALRDAAAAHAARVEPLGEDRFLNLRLEQAWRTFRASSGRSALLLLAGDVGAQLTEDVALVADEDFLAALSAEVRLEPEGTLGDNGKRSKSQPERSALRWKLEGATWRLLCRNAAAEDSDEVGRAALLRHGGALGRFPDLLLELVATSSDADAFGERLLTEQRYFLEDSDPSARLRAHEWMLARDVAVPNYDPLGERQDRRAALKAFAASSTIKVQSDDLPDDPPGDQNRAQDRKRDSEEEGQE